MNLPMMFQSDSSQVDQFGYDEPTQTLHVIFKRGGHYSYADVPAQKFESMKAAPSHGKFLGAEIKPHHKFTKHS